MRDPACACLHYVLTYSTIVRYKASFTLSDASHKLTNDAAVLRVHICLYTYKETYFFKIARPAAAYQIRSTPEYVVQYLYLVSGHACQMHLARLNSNTMYP